MANLLPISDADFDSAEQFFKNNPTQTKIDRKGTDSLGNYSFIKVQNEIYAVANKDHYGEDALLGEGGYSKIKLIQNRNGDNFAVKIEGRALRSEENAEIKVKKLLGQKTSQAGRILDSPKKFKGNLIGRKLYTINDLEKGQELYEALYNNSPFFPNQLLIALIGTSVQLEKMHAQGIIHGDLKENNLMADIQGEQIVIAPIDFGFSKILAPGQNEIISKNIEGTPEYMAPEIKDPTGDGAIYSTAADIYSLGQMMIFMANFPEEQIKYWEDELQALENKPLNQREVNHDDLVQDSKDQIDFYKNLANLYEDDIIDPLNDLSKKMIAPDRGDRPSAKEITAGFVQALERIMPQLDKDQKFAAQAAIEKTKPLFALDIIFNQKLSEQYQQAKSSHTMPTQQLFSSYQTKVPKIEFALEKERALAIAQADTLIERLKNERMPVTEKATIAYGALLQLKNTITDNPSPANVQLKKICDEKMDSIEKAFPGNNVKNDALNKAQAFAAPLEKKTILSPR